jgi:hypothetical protein
MAKFCEVCKRSYPDDRQSCPYCAGAAEDSGIDLDAPQGEAPSSISGVSAVDYVEVVDEPAAPAAGAAATTAADPPGDTPDVVEEVQEGAEGKDPTPPKKTSIAPVAKATALASQSPPKVTALASQSPPKVTALASDQEMVRDLLGGEPAGLVPEPGPAPAEPPVAAPPPPTEDTSAEAESACVHLGEPVEESLDPGAAEVEEVGASGVNLADVGEEAVLAEAASDSARVEPVSESGIDLGEEVVVEDVTGEPLPGKVVAGDSGVQLTGIAPAAAAPETPLPGGPPIAADSGVALDKDLVLEEPVTPKPADAASAEGISSRDLIAEAVESGVDLPGPQSEVVESESDEVVTLDTGGTPAEAAFSSAVDLGSSAEVELPPVSSVPGASEVSEGGEAVDLAGLPELPPSGSGLSVPEVSASSVDLGSQHEVATEEAPGASVSEEPVVESGIDLGEAAESEGVPVGADDEAVEEEEEAPVGADDEAVEEEERAPVGAGVGAEGGAPAARPRGRKGAWFGGTILGLLLGAGTLMGLWLFGIEPPKEWRDMVGLAPKDTKPAGPKGPGGLSKGPAMVESPGDLLRRGEFEKAIQASAGQGQAPTPEQLSERGQARWLSYFTRQKQAKAPVKADDEAVKQAVADLTAAGPNNANALFWLGHIQEQTGKPKEAEATYAKGVEQFKANPDQKLLFEAALYRMKAMSPQAPPAGGAWLPPEWRNDSLALAALVLFALQQPMGEKSPVPAEQPASAPEAGFDFWKAVDLAREQKYAEAVAALDKARAAHDQLRFTRLKKAQNPRSDPIEDIFIKSCDELKAYWQAEAKLKQGGYLNLTDQKDPGKAIDGLVKEAADLGKKLKGLGDTLAKDKIIDKPEDLEKGVTQLLTDRKKAMADIAELDNMLKDSTKKAMDLAAMLKTSKDEAAVLDKKLKEAIERETKLKADLAAEQAALQGMAKDLKEAKFVDPAAGKEGLLKGLKDAVRIARMVDPKGHIQKLEGQVERCEAERKQQTTRYEAELKQQKTGYETELKQQKAGYEAELQRRWRPTEMLAFWLPLLEQDRSRKDLSANAVLDAGRVLKDPQATPADRAHAEVIRGLALRNEEKFAEAREALQKAQEDLKGDRNVWVARTEEALKEVSDPAAWYTARAEALHNQGKSDAALELLGRAVEALPKEQAALLAQRSLIELDVARAAAKGAIPPRDPMLVAARKDAEAAANAKLAEGYYAAGRVAEELGQWDKAAEYYRQAMETHPALDAAGSRYAIARARALVQPREGRPAGELPPIQPVVPPPPPKAEGDKVGRLDLPPDAARRAEALRFAVLLSVLALQAPDLQPPTPAQEEADKLADEVLKAGDKVPFDVRAQALAIKGRWTMALLTYVEGLRSHLPPRYAGGLLELVRNHPRLKRPDTLRVPNPFDAERNYAAGLNYYFARDYPAAEKSFAAAVENDSQDARYFYFLGLAKLAQNKRDAYDDLDQGAVLESQNRPPAATVSVALERIQGPLRRVINDARTKPR